MIKSEIGLSYLTARELFHYDQETGIIIWIVSKKGLKAGSYAGYIDSAGYRIIRIKGRNYKAHRLAWLLAYHFFPSLDIDHINGDRSDNRIENLRQVTNSENQQNQRIARKDNKTGMLGVCFHEHSKKFNARIKLNGKQISLGYFETAAEAHEKYLHAKRQFHPACTI